MHLWRSLVDLNFPRAPNFDCSIGHIENTEFIRLGGAEVPCPIKFLSRVKKKVGELNVARERFEDMLPGSSCVGKTQSYRFVG